MRLLVVCVLLGCVWVRETFAQGGGGGSSSWACDTFTPNLQQLQGQSPSDPPTSPFRIALNRTTVTAGHDITVTLMVDRNSHPNSELSAFIIQARLVGSNVPQGRWAIPNGNVHAMTRQCGEHEDDTATNKQFHFVQVLELKWVAPDNVPTGYRVELVGAALDGTQQKYWTLHGNSIVWIEVTTATLVQEGETEGGNEGGQQPGGEEISDLDLDPQVTTLDEEDEHDLLLETRMEMEYLKKKQDDIALENLATENDGTLEDEKKKRQEEYNRELEDYEKTRYEEEVKRQARIDAELKDKEEWDAQQREEQLRREEEEERRRQLRRERLGDTLQEVDIDETETEDTKKTSGGCRQTSTFTLYSGFLLILYCLL